MWIAIYVFFSDEYLLTYDFLMMLISSNLCGARSRLDGKTSLELFSGLLNYEMA